MKVQLTQEMLDRANSNLRPDGQASAYVSDSCIVAQLLHKAWNQQENFLKVAILTNGGTHARIVFTNTRALDLFLINEYHPLVVLVSLFDNEAHVALSEAVGKEFEVPTWDEIMKEYATIYE